MIEMKFWALCQKSWVGEGHPCGRVKIVNTRLFVYCVINWGQGSKIVGFFHFKDKDIPFQILFTKILAIKCFEIMSGTPRKLD